MIDRAKILTIVAAAFLALWSSLTWAAPLTPEVRCETGKLKAVASYASCRLKADSRGLVNNESPNFDSCAEKILARFPKLEDDAGAGVCPSENDVADIKDRTEDFETAVAILLSGGSLPPPTCGNGTIELGEDCDSGNLDGETCQSQLFFNGTLACGPDCNFDTSGCNATRFEDTGSTIIDHLVDASIGRYSEVEWEKKDSSGGGANLVNPHDVDNLYTWAATAVSAPSGTAFSDFLFKLNGTTAEPTTGAATTTTGCYANHCDWRLPNIDELKSIAILSPGCAGAPCTQDNVFLPNKSLRYWSNSSFAAPTTGAYFLDFSDGTPSADDKTVSYSVRAVRSRS